MTNTQLNLLFPQWQGSGPENELYHAAIAVVNSFPDIEFTRVDVPETESLTPANGILGYDSIYTQMRQAGDIIRQADPDAVFTLGGDCGIEPVPVSYLNHKYGKKFILIWLDAHADMNTPQTSPSGHFHGMPLATLMGLGDAGLRSACFSSLKPEQVILAGTRDFDPAEARLIRSMGMTHLSVEAMETDPGILARTAMEKGGHPVYVHIDFDILEPGIFPHIQHPEPGGVFPETLLVMLEDLRNACPVVGLGLMEFILPRSRNSAMDIQGLEIVTSLIGQSCAPGLLG